MKKMITYSTESAMVASEIGAWVDCIVVLSFMTIALLGRFL